MNLDNYIQHFSHSFFGYIEICWGKSLPEMMMRTSSCHKSCSKSFRSCGSLCPIWVLLYWRWRLGRKPPVKVGDVCDVWGDQPPELAERDGWKIMENPPWMSRCISYWRWAFSNVMFVFRGGFGTIFLVDHHVLSFSPMVWLVIQRFVCCGV